MSIVGDSNDADYITKTEKYDKSTFEEIVPYLYLLNYKYNKDYQLKEFPYREYISLPYSEFGVCHSLEKLSIKFFDKGTAYEVNLPYSKDTLDKVSELIKKEQEEYDDEF